MGRPVKLTADVHAEIVKRLASGCSVEVAAAASGVSRRTVFSWLERGRTASRDNAPASETPFIEFADAVERARAEVEVLALATIMNAARKGAWQAAAWFLERTNPEEYAPQKKKMGRPVGAVSAPDRSAAPPRVTKLKAVS